MPGCIDTHREKVAFPGKFASSKRLSTVLNFPYYRITSVKWKARSELTRISNDAPLASVSVRPVGTNIELPPCTLFFFFLYPRHWLANDPHPNLTSISVVCFSIIAVSGMIWTSCWDIRYDQISLTSLARQHTTFWSFLRCEVSQSHPNFDPLCFGLWCWDHSQLSSRFTYRNFQYRATMQIRVDSDNRSFN